MSENLAKSISLLSIAYLAILYQIPEIHNYEKKAGVTGNDYLTNRAQSFENRKNKNICYKKG